MNYLVIETSAHTVSVAVVTLEGVLGELTMNTGHTHSEKLMPVMDALLEQLDLSLSDLQGLVVASGPGSFTGIRIGMATVKGLAHGAGLPVLPVSTLEGLAWNLAGCGGLVCPLLDARRDQVYAALFDCSGAIPLRLEADSAQAISDVIQALKARQEPVWFTGDALPRFKALIEEAMGGQARFPQKHLWHQRAASLGMAALLAEPGRLPVPYGEAVPQYLKKTEAERNYEQRNAP